MNEFQFDLQRFANPITSVSDLTSVEGGYYTLAAGSHTIQAGTVLELDKPLVIESGAEVTIILEAKQGDGTDGQWLYGAITESDNFTDTSNINSLIQVKGSGSLNIQGSSAINNTITASKVASAISLVKGDGTDSNTPTLTIGGASGSTATDADSFPTIRGQVYGIKAETGTINVNGGYVEGIEGSGIYQEAGTLNISKSTDSPTTVAASVITGKTSGVKMDAGTLNVGNTTIDATDSTGSAIEIDGMGVTANITGGKIGSTAGTSLLIDDDTTAGTQTSVTISGGTFSSATPITNNDSDAKVTINGGAFKTVPSGTGITPPATSYNLDGMTTYYSTSTQSSAENAAIAAGAVAKIGNNYYTTLAKAFNAANSAGSAQTVTLLSNITLDGWIGITGEVTLDLNGKTVTKDSNFSFVVQTSGSNKGKFTVDDTSSGAAGTITGTSNVILVGNGANSPGEFTLKKGNITATGNAINANNGSSVKIEGGKVTTSGANYCAVLVSDNADFSMSNGEVAATNGFGVYFNSGSTEKTYSLNGGKVEAKNGVTSWNTGATINLNGTSVEATSFGVQLTAGKLVMGESTSATTTSTVTSSGYYGVYVANGSDFTLNAGTVKTTVAGGMGVYLASAAGVDGDYSATTGASNTFTMNGGTIETKWESGEKGSNQMQGVWVAQNNTFNMYGGTITANGYKTSSSSGSGSTETIQANGVVVLGNSTFTMGQSGDSTSTPTITSNTGFGLTGNGTVGTTSSNYGVNAEFNLVKGSITSYSDQAIYLPHLNGKTTVQEGMTITGGTGIEIRAGELDIQGGTIKATKYTIDSSGNATESTSYQESDYHYTPNGNGSTTSGAGIALAQHTTEGDITINISNGTISGPVALSIANPQDNPKKNPDAQQVVNISGGTFTGYISSVVTNKETVYGISSGASDTQDDSTGEIAATAINNAEARVRVAITGGTFTGGLAATTHFTDTGTSLTTETTDSSEATYKALTSSGGYVLSQATFTNKEDVPKGYAYTASDNKYTVNFTDGFSVNGKTYSTFAEAIEAAKEGGTVMLLGAVDLESTFDISSKVSIELNGHTITSYVENLFNVQANGTLTISDSTGNGLIELGSASITDDTALIKVAGDSSKFVMTSGKLSSKYTLLRLTNGATADITNTAELTIDSNKTAGQGYAIVYDATSSVNFGGNAKINVAGSTSSSNTTAAIYGIAKTSEQTESAKLNIYGGTISIGDDKAKDYAVYANAGTVKISNGSLSAEEAGVYLSGTATLDVSGGLIKATQTTGDGIYLASTGSALIAGANTTVMGGGNAVFNAGQANAVSIGVGTTFNDKTSNAYTHYETQQSGSNGGYAYNFVDAKFASVDNGYNFVFDGSVYNGFVDGAATLAFAGDLFDASKVGDAVSAITIGKDSVVAISNTDNFVTTDGASLKVSTAGYTLNTDLYAEGTETSLSPFKDAGTYYASDKFTTISSSVGNYAFYGKGADTDGFNAADNVLTYYTARTDAFTLGGNLKVADSVMSGSIGSYLSVKDGSVSIISDGFFNSTQAANQDLRVTKGDYTLTFGSDFAGKVAYNDHPSFTTVNSGEDNKAYVYTFAGAKEAGYSEKSGVITYNLAADTLSFADDGVYDGGAGDTIINFASSILGEEDASKWFTVDKENHGITINSAALSGTQADGAYLSLTGGNYTVAFADGIVSDATLYSDAASFGTLGGGSSSVNNYLYTTKGMSVSGATNYILASVAGGESSVTALTYHDTAKQASLTATGVSLSTDASLYSFENNVFTISTISAFNQDASADINSRLSEGDKITIAGGDYTLKFADKAGFSIVSGDDINGAATYSAATNTYTGVGASVAGFETITGGYTYHEKYDKFSFAGGDNSIAVDADNFVESIDITNKTILLKSGVFDKDSLAQGQTISLSAASVADGYKLQIGGKSGLTQAEAPNLNKAFDTANNYYEWNSAGADAAGYALTDNSVVTYS